jgi:outer membrane protein
LLSAGASWADPPAAPAPAAPVAAQAPPAPTSPPGGSAAQPVSLSLSEALKRALEANPAVAQARLEVAAQTSQKKAVLSSILPHVSVAASGTRNSLESSFGSGDEKRVILPRDDWNSRLTLTQPIYAGQRERKAYDQAKIGIENARQSTLSAEDALLLNVVADYFAVLEGEELIEVEQKNLALAEQRRKQATDLYEAGETTQVERLRAETDVKSSQRQLAAARQRREVAVGRLRLDLALEGPIAVSDPGEPGTTFPALPPSAALTAQAETSRPELAQAANDLEIARLEVGKQRGFWLPVVTAEGGWLKQRSTFPSDSYGYFKLNFSVPLFDAGEISNRVAAAKERLHQAELRVTQLKQQVREEVHQAFSDLETARANLALAAEQLTAAEAEYAQASELKRAQEITALESEAAEAALADARRAVATSRLDARLAELRVWSAAGRLKQAVLPEEVR